MGNADISYYVMYIYVSSYKTRFIASKRREMFSQADLSMKTYGLQHARFS